MTCADARVSLSPGGAFLGIALLAGTTLAPVPQSLKIARAGNAEGVSPTMFGMLGLYNCLNLSGLILTKWRTVKLCLHEAHCVLDLLDVLQLCFSCVWNLAIMIQAVRQSPHCRPRKKAMAGGISVLAATILMGSCVLAALSTCSDVSLDVAQGLSYAASCCVFVAFAPQLASTWALKGAGSLSLISFLIQGVGNFAVACNYAFVELDPWTAWAPVCVAFVMQTAIFILLVHYNCLERRAVARWKAGEPVSLVREPGRAGDFEGTGPQQGEEQRRRLTEPLC